ncbi:MAG TPA: hypothetical protein VJB11_02040 [archaeon]|nr:hypothetical protein [archaeon]
MNRRKFIEGVAYSSAALVLPGCDWFDRRETEYEHENTNKEPVINTYRDYLFNRLDKKTKKRLFELEEEFASISVGFYNSPDYHMADPKFPDYEPTMKEILEKRDEVLEATDIKAEWTVQQLNSKLIPFHVNFRYYEK